MTPEQRAELVRIAGVFRSETEKLKRLMNERGDMFTLWGAWHTLFSLPNVLEMIAAEDELEVADAH